MRVDNASPLRTPRSRRLVARAPAETGRRPNKRQVLIRQRISQLEALELGPTMERTRHGVKVNRWSLPVGLGDWPHGAGKLSPGCAIGDRAPHQARWITHILDTAPPAWSGGTCARVRYFEKMPPVFWRLIDFDFGVVRNPGGPIGPRNRVPSKLHNPGQSCESAMVNPGRPRPADRGRPVRQRDPRSGPCAATG